MKFFKRLFNEREQSTSQDKAITQEKTTENSDLLEFQNLYSKLMKSSQLKATLLGTVGNFYLLFIDNKLCFINNKLQYEFVFMKEMKWYESNDNGIYLSISENYYLNKNFTVINSYSHFKLSSLQATSFKEHINYLETFYNTTFLEECINLIAEKKSTFSPYLEAYYKTYISEHPSYEEYLQAIENCNDFSFNQYYQSYNPYKLKDLIELLISKKMFDEKNTIHLELSLLLSLKEIIINVQGEYFYANYKEPNLRNIKNFQDIMYFFYKNPFKNNQDLWRAVYFYINSNDLTSKITNEEIIQLYKDANSYMESFSQNKKLEELEYRLSLEITGLSNFEKPSLADIDLMTGIEFEDIVAIMLEKLGYTVLKTKVTGDQGIDLIAQRGNLNIGIQVKRYSEKVSNKAVQEVVAGLNHYKLDKGIVITNNYYTSSAKELADSNNIILWDRDMLNIQLKEAFK